RRAGDVYLQHGLARGALGGAQASVGVAREDLRQARARREDVATAPSSGHGTASEDGEDPSSMGPADGPAT
ncbi:MAG: hypothetical protein AAFU49_19940, partial [Pseudomonadota bacterium]